MRVLRRYEILVPLLFNNGEPVPEELLSLTLKELRLQFGATSWETQTVQGLWEHEGTTYRDNLTRFFVDVPDIPANRLFFENLKIRLKERFRQLEIWITSYQIEVI